MAVRGFPSISWGCYPGCLPGAFKGKKMGIYKKHNQEIEIDDEMLPAIKALNELGLETHSCCAGHPERHKTKAQIAFRAENVDVIISNGIVSINWNRHILKGTEIFRD